MAYLVMIVLLTYKKLMRILTVSKLIWGLKRETRYQEMFINLKMGIEYPLLDWGKKFTKKSGKLLKKLQQMLKDGEMNITKPITPISVALYL